MKINLTLTLVAILALIGVSDAYGQVFEQHLLADSLNLIDDIAACDLDLDGDVDVLCSELIIEPSWHSNLLWWENDGDGNFIRHTLADGFKRLQGITPLDFDGDGDIDILLAGGEEYYDEFSIMENTGELNFERHVIPANFDRLGKANEIDAADLNGDGNLDIVVTFLSRSVFDDYYGGIKIYFQTEPFTFEDITLVDNGDCGWKDLFLLDFDQNGAIDVIATDHYFYRSNYDFTFGWWANYDGEFEYNSFLAGMYYANNNLVDLNRDGRMDILNCDTDVDLDSTAIIWMENLDGQGFEHHRLYTFNGYRIINSVVADYDLDDDFDIVTCGFGLEYYENDGNEPFEYRRIPINHVNFQQIINADITGNGRLDLIARNENWHSNAGVIYWFENIDERSAPLPDEVLPTEFSLTGAFPNPFNAVTRLTYGLPAAGKINLSIYDINGREIATLFSGDQAAGMHSISWNAEGVPSGVYFCRLSTATQSHSQKVVLVR